MSSTSFGGVSVRASNPSSAQRDAATQAAGIAPFEEVRQSNAHGNIVGIDSCEVWHPVFALPQFEVLALRKGLPQVVIAQLQVAATTVVSPEMNTKGPCFGRLRNGHDGFAHRDARRASPWLPGPRYRDFPLRSRLPR